MSPGSFKTDLEAALGARVTSLFPISGGNICEAFEAVLDGSVRVFVKHKEGVPIDFFQAEARGLRFLSEPNVIRVPKVIHASHTFLVLEYVASARPSKTYAERLGQTLAALHHHTNETFGLGDNNFIGSLPQRNTPHKTWAEFYVQERIAPQIDLAAKKGRTTRAMKQGLAFLETFDWPQEQPSRIHGDLWAGNAMVDEHGAPCLVDPAAHFGFREMDLAMMRLFGGFTETTFAAYDEAFCLAPDYEERVELCQLYPLLVHVNLFGGHYVDRVDAIFRRYA